MLTRRPPCGTATRPALGRGTQNMALPRATSSPWHCRVTHLLLRQSQPGPAPAAASPTAS